jgi:signal transduction histidine kinase/CheY-like chemotaxis protein
MGRAYQVYSLWTLPLVVIMVRVVVRGLKRRADTLTLLLSSALFAFATTGILDMLTDMGLLHLPRLFALSITNAPMMAGTVVIGTFISMAQHNQVLTRSLARSNEELAVALADAREATRVKSEFLANVSHELRTPLNSIINIPEGLLEDFEAHGDQTRYTGDAARTAKYLTTLHTSGVHLLGVVNQVLDFSKLEAGRMALQAERVMAGPLLDDVTRTLESLASRRGITLRTEGTLDTHFKADPVKVAQVLLNLGNNAVKFSPDGGTVTFKVAASQTGVSFRVSDQGIGIAPENLELIFEGFRQVEGGATRRFGGTGLGLAISRRLVGLHGGTLTVESTLGQGSTFVASFPLEPGPAVEVTPLHLPTPRASVLVIDDEPIVQETLRLSLRHLEVDVVPIEDPRQALEAARTRRPALLILDVMMPRISGLTLLRQLREDEALRTTPVLVLSAHPSNRELAVSLGARWLSKPWNPDQLVAQVRELTGLDQTGAQA